MGEGQRTRVWETQGGLQSLGIWLFVFLLLLSQRPSTSLKSTTYHACPQIPDPPALLLQSHLSPTRLATSPYLTTSPNGSSLEIKIQKFPHHVGLPVTLSYVHQTHSFPFASFLFSKSYLLILASFSFLPFLPWAR